MKSTPVITDIARRDQGCFTLSRTGLHTGDKNGIYLFINVLYNSVCMFCVFLLCLLFVVVVLGHVRVKAISRSKTFQGNRWLGFSSRLPQQRKSEEV